MDAKLAAGLLWTVYHLLEGLVLLLIPRWLRYKPIDGEVVLVTGSGSGLGRHLALRFARLGARLVLWDLSPEPNEETARLVRAAGGQAWAYSCDVSDREAVYRLAEQVRKDVPDPVSILVNNAGVVNGERLLATPDEAIIRTLQVNTMSHFWTVKAFLPDMLTAKKGHIVGVASLAGLGGASKLVDYCASKFAAVGLLEALAMELHVEGYEHIHTTTVCPFLINTGMFAGVDTGYLPALEPEHVADEIIAAIRCNQRVAVIPSYFNVFVFLKMLLPVHSLVALHDALGGRQAMVGFVGRKGKTA